MAEIEVLRKVSQTRLIDHSELSDQLATASAKKQALQRELDMANKRGDGAVES